MVTLFLCWFCFGLLRVFSDDNNSKQKTPHKEPCTWQTSCWWDIQSLRYQTQRMQCENYQNNNQHCIKKIPQYQTQFLLVGQLVVNAAQYSINLIEKEFLFFQLYYQIWESHNYCRKYCPAAYWSFSFSGIRQSGSLWPTQAYWSNNLKVQSIFSFCDIPKSSKLKKKILWHTPSAILK